MIRKTWSTLARIYRTGDYAGVAIATMAARALLWPTERPRLRLVTEHVGALLNHTKNKVTSIYAGYHMLPEKRAAVGVTATGVAGRRAPFQEVLKWNNAIVFG